MTYAITLIFAVLIGGSVGWLAERSRLVRNGVVASAAIGVGGSVILFLLADLFGAIPVWRVVWSAIGAVAALAAARYGRPV